MIGEILKSKNFSVFVDVGKRLSLETHSHLEAFSNRTLMQTPASVIVEYAFHTTQVALHNHSDVFVIEK